MNSETSKHVSLVIIAIAFMVFVYGTIKVIEIVDKTQVGTSEGIYTSYVTSSKEIEKQAHALTADCKSELCEVQALLDFASTIPYETKTFQRYSPQKTIQQNFGDCDDKSNLLISMLHALGKEAYFVLVPKHIFVITPVKEPLLAKRKGLWINGKKYYILESTAKNSRVGFPLHYALEEIDVIVEPFTNEKIEINKLLDRGKN